MAIAMRFAALSDIGLVRSTNQDSGYAGPHLLVVADGMGGHAGGDVASSITVGELAALDGESHGGDDAMSTLEKAARSANLELRRRARAEPKLAGMGTTMTALLRTGNKLVVGHIGDSRAYLLRDGQLTQITRDHSLVQALVDQGQLTPDEAEHHPQRSVLMRVFTGDPDDILDLSVREARAGDRYLLCSDGLSGVVSSETILETLASEDPPREVAERLIQLALRGGGPDNITCVVADVVSAEADRSPTTPEVVGAAAANRPRRSTGSQTSPAAKAAALREATEPDGEETADEDAADDPSPARRGRSVVTIAVLLVLLLGGGYAAYRWTQQQYFLGKAGDRVAIYRGLPQDLGPLRLSTIVKTTDLAVADLPVFARQQVTERRITPRDLRAAEQSVAALRQQACRGAASGPATPVPSATPTTGPPTGGPRAAPPVAASPGATARASGPAGPPAAPTTAAPVSPTPGGTSTTGTSTGTSTECAGVG